MPSFNPLRNVKRTVQPYDPLPGGNSYVDSDDDIEKRRSIDSLDYQDSADSSPSAYASRVSNMQGTTTSAQFHRNRSDSRARKASMSQHQPPSYSPSSYYYSHRVGRRRFSRWFALALGGTVVLFIIWLSAMGRRSHIAVETGEAVSEMPAPPAPWESFPFLKRYHGGIRTLVPRLDNKPEYPGDGFNASELLGARNEDGQLERRAEVGGDGWSYDDERSKDHGLPPMQVFDPYPDYSSAEYKKKYGAEVKACFLDEKRLQRVPLMRSYPGVVNGTPENVMGSYEIFGIRDDVCFERFGRLGPYGLGYSRKYGGSGAGMEGDREGADQVWEDDEQVDFRKVRWADVQRRCIDDNEHRFKPRGTPIGNGRSHFYFDGYVEQTAEGVPEKEIEARDPQMDDPAPPMPHANDEGAKPFKPVDMSSGSTDVKSEKSGKKQSSEDGETKPFRLVDTSASQSSGSSVEKPKQARKLLPRTAVLIRTWHDFQYDDEDLFYLRAITTELAVNSGGEYEVHLLIHVKDNDLPIWSDEETYQRVLNESLPEEFRGMGTLWTERQMSLVYGGLAESNYRDLPVYGAYRSSFLPVQHFAHMHPEYDFFWHWEMDVRYTGHFYHLFSKVSEWAKQQPRKGLWERNSRFYVPREHGPWEDFKHMVRVQTEHGTASKNNMWAEMAKDDPNVPEEVKAQSVQKPEKPIWGPEVSEADEMDTQDDPEVPPIGKDKYEWGVGEEADLITFNPLFDPDHTNWILAGDVTGYDTSKGLPPRRTAIITAARLSKRLLKIMHRETSLRKRTMFSEMWPPTCALHHGLKAVYAPHPVFIDRRWPTDYLAAIMNNGRNGAAGGARMSVFSDERQHNFRGTSWYYNSGFAPNLWRRWLGYVVDNDGGEAEEVWGEGRMCLPAMLLHPVKHVDLVFEHADGAE
ncbi:hypothetical protein UCRNP2_8742 [Neofusicoccum parvum UCRNP2]|uniref:Major facilitator superfamily transporter protein n=1 Tax=Botryosphaeria parva (strain UCR-NP2) TaxID=1287680 RepID=R1GF53_BOTPV|nr:hypothetical protein UCRNP2_8742 [Neofusicoccum parvum UCRNP2]